MYSKGKRIKIMIDLKFGLFWSGAPLSYLRYLTFKTLRHYHPDSEIELYVSDDYVKDGFSWHCEKQDFLYEGENKDYIDELKELDVKIIKTDQFSNYPPNFSSDFFRWWWLKNNSGFYLDTDQIILKSFSDLPLDYELIYSCYQARSCGIYAPVGCIGANRPHIVDFTYDIMHKFYDKNNYNSLGPFMFIYVLNMKPWGNIINMSSNCFYPIPESYLVQDIYKGKLDLLKGKMGSGNEVYSCHWFGGHPESQNFNNKYTEEFAKTSKDSISVFLRHNDLI